jgi:hypothetical protein
MQQDQISSLLYGDGSNVRPLVGLEALVARQGDTLEAERGPDGVWVVTFPEETPHES